MDSSFDTFLSNPKKHCRCGGTNHARITSDLCPLNPRGSRQTHKHKINHEAPIGCKCGSTNHARVTSNSCPLNPRNVKRPRIEDGEIDTDNGSNDGGMNSGDDGNPGRYHEYNEVRGSLREKDDHEAPRRCKCGSTGHARVTSNSCPLNPRNVTRPRIEGGEVDTDNESDDGGTNSDDDGNPGRYHEYDVVRGSLRGKNDHEAPRRCKCGSTGHARVTFNSCPLNPRNVKRRRIEGGEVDTENESDDGGINNDDGGDPERYHEYDEVRGSLRERRRRSSQ